MAEDRPTSKEERRSGRRDGGRDAHEANSDLSAVLLRLLVGGAVEGTDLVLRRLRDPEPSTPGVPARDDEPPDEGLTDRARHALIGLLFEACTAASRGVATAGNVAATAGRFWWSVLEPVARSPLLGPVRRPYEALVERGAEELERWARIGRAEEQRSRDLARRLALAPVEDIVAHLQDNPEMQALVRKQAETLLAELPDDSQVRSVVRAQGDDYIDHLRENPRAIQELVQGQSVGLVSEVTDALRERTVTADTLLERFVRAVLRRRPRERLPAPPRKVQGHAERPRGSDE